MTNVLQDDDEHFGPKIIRNATVTSISTDRVLEPTFDRPGQPHYGWSNSYGDRFEIAA
jgi:hypothetical protein